MTHRVLKSHRGHIVFMTTCILRPSCFCEIWALCVSWIIYDHLYYAPSVSCRALFGSLVPAMSNRTSCAQVHELPQSNCGDSWDGTLFSWLHVYYTHLASVRGFKSHSGQLSIATSVVNTICIIHSATLILLPQETFNQNKHGDWQRQ